jgi:ATP-dependent DNA helicase DinG
MANTFRQDAFHTLLRKLFTEALPAHGFAPREKQIELADEILSAFGGRNVLLAESEVGTGKTLAYLLPAALARRGRLNERKILTVLPDGKQAPVAIATSSIALQRAIELDHVPTLSGILMELGVIKTPLTCVLRKGKGHFLCERRLLHFAHFADAETEGLLGPIIRGTLIDLAAAKNLTPYIKRHICVDKSCGHGCPRHGECRYMRYMRSAGHGGYDFQVCNHNYLLADLIRRSTEQRPLIPEYQGLVIDEAHKFTDAARDMYGAELPLAELCRAARDADGITFASGTSTAGISREADRILSKSRLLFSLLNKEAPAMHDEDDAAERRPTKIRQQSEAIMRVLKENIDNLADMLAVRAVGAKYAQRKRDALRSLNRMSDSLDLFIHHSGLVYWLEEADEVSESDFPLSVLRGIPKDLGELLCRDLWGRDIPIILTSGTLSAAGSFEYIKKKSGLGLLPQGRLLETSKPSPFNYRENALIYISERTPFPDTSDEGYIEAVTDETMRLVTAAHGHTALLFTSYKAMDMVHERIAARSLPYPVFRLDRSGVAAIERFKASAGGVLFASGALWEGIDLPGDVLSMLVIARLPFAVPDPVSEWERTLYSGMDEYKREVIVPEMLVKLKQGFGRLIRTEGDTGVCAILDSRAGEGGPYRRHVLAALPPCPVTSAATDVEAFIRAKKEEPYFMEGMV